MMKDRALSLLPNPSAAIEVSPAEVAEWFENPKENRPMLIDCREADELLVCRIKGHEWIPLREIPHRMEAIRDQSANGVVVYCHHGMRSLRAAEFLRGHGIEAVFSMRGGIDLWAETVDPSMTRY